MTKYVGDTFGDQNVKSVTIITMSPTSLLAVYFNNPMSDFQLITLNRLEIIEKQIKIDQ